MIASVRGTVRSVRLDSAVIEVGGVGLLVATTPETAAGLRVGAEAELATSLVVREDSLTLFGFAEADARDVFETVQGVAGIGPRLALAMLAVHDPATLRLAVATGDVATLRRVPGIGLKVAQRILLELTGKLGVVEDPAAPTSAAPGSGWTEQVEAALVSLGWSQRQAEQALSAIGPDQADTASALRAALRHLGRSA